MATSAGERCEVYVLTNAVNGKRYVGITTRTLMTRWTEHVRAARLKRDNGMAITRAIKKYGPHAFEVNVLEECSTLEGLHFAEKQWIKKLETFAPDGQKGYNLTRGGEGGVGHVVSDESRKRSSESHKRENLSAQTLAKMRESAKIAGGWKRVPRDIEARRVENMRGKNNPYFRQKTPWQRNRPWTAVERKAIGQAHLGKKLTSEHKANITVGVNEYYAVHDGPNLGKPWTDEMRFKQAKINHLRKKPVFGYNVAGECVVVYLSVDDAQIATGLGAAILKGKRRVPKYFDGITYKRTDMTINQLKNLEGHHGLP